MTDKARIENGTKNSIQYIDKVATDEIEPSSVAGNQVSVQCRDLSVAA
jgi:hypothetical protein